MASSSTPRCHRPLVRPPDTRGVGGVAQDRLAKHREVSIPGAVDVRLTSETGVALGDTADHECASPRQRRVLVVEDSDLWRDVICGFFRRRPERWELVEADGCSGVRASERTFTSDHGTGI